MHLAITCLHQTQPYRKIPFSVSNNSCRCDLDINWRSIKMLWTGKAKEVRPIMQSLTFYHSIIFTVSKKNNLSIKQFSTNRHANGRTAWLRWFLRLTLFFSLESKVTKRWNKYAWKIMNYRKCKSSIKVAFAITVNGGTIKDYWHKWFNLRRTLL